MDRSGQYESEQPNRQKLQGFRISYPKALLTCVGVLLSCGLLLIILFWKKSLFLQCTHTACSLERAEKILIVDSYNQEFVSSVQRSKISSSLQVPFFYYKRLKYNWSEEVSNFVNISGLQIDRCSELHSLIGGLDSIDVQERLRIYGSNSVNIAVKPIVTLIFREISNPFYLYQAFSATVWCLQYYYVFAICMVLLSVLSVSATVWETRKQSRSLRDAMHIESLATVIRDGKEIQIDSEELCPGDVMVLSPSTFTMSCDAVLLYGTCVVNESMLTGESNPITKVPLADDPDTVFDSNSQHKRSILSCGTEVLLSRSTDASKVKAIVYRTGFSTAKGELVRAILFPKPVKLKLYSDFLKCSIIFFSLGIPAVTYTSLVGVNLGAYSGDVVLFVLNVVTFFFPPALPAVLTSINEQAQRRLRKQGIYCLNTRYIHFAAGLDIICFDKTGTLTEENLDIMAVVPVQNGKFERAVENLERMSSDVLQKTFATCHSLSRIDDELMGYDLDIKMFKATGWDLQEPTSRENIPFDFRPPRIVFPKYSDEKHQPSVAILKQFPFESSLRRMSVLTVTEGTGSFQAFLKGSPELVVSLCRKETVPNDAEEMIDYYSSQGFRVIGIAIKSLPEDLTYEHALTLSREDLESGMELLGLVILENKLKPETVPALDTLKEADIKSVMVTGDNLLTAITVGKKCGIVDDLDSLVVMKVSRECNQMGTIQLQVSYKYADSHASNQNDCLVSSEKNTDDSRIYVGLEDKHRIALEGTSFNLLRMHDRDLLEKVVVKGAIFARMLPEDKLFLIEHYQNLGYQVGMCGDGANDCGALKTAHTGVSLSVEEASVAAPFTSTHPDIRCIPTLIREGRVTLMTTFDSFRYMVCYVFIFLLVVLFLFWDGQRPSDGAYIVIDLVINLAPPFLMGATEAFPGLSRKRPLRSILSFVPLFSVFSFITIQAGMLLITSSYCSGQPWYEAFSFKTEDAHTPDASHRGTTLLTVNMMAYVTAIAIFASGPPYRNGFFSNRKYALLFVFEFVVVSYVMVYPPDFLMSFLNFKRAPSLTYNLNLYAISLGGFLFCFIYEKFFVQGFLAHHVVPALKRRRGPVRRYEKLQEKLQDWPPLEDCLSAKVKTVTPKCLTTFEKNNILQNVDKC